MLKNPYARNTESGCNVVYTRKQGGIASQHAMVCHGVTGNVFTLLQSYC